MGHIGMNKRQVTNPTTKTMENRHRESHRTIASFDGPISGSSVIGGLQRKTK